MNVNFSPGKNKGIITEVAKAPRTPEMLWTTYKGWNLGLRKCLCIVHMKSKNGAKRRCYITIYNTDIYFDENIGIIPEGRNRWKSMHSHLQITKRTEQLNKRLQPKTTATRIGKYVNRLFTQTVTGFNYIVEIEKAKDWKEKERLSVKGKW